MVNIIGAMLTGIACGYLGLKKCEDMKKRVKSLEDITLPLRYSKAKYLFHKTNLQRHFQILTETDFLKMYQNT